MDAPSVTETTSEGSVRFNRPPRVQRPLPQREIMLPAPPVPGDPQNRNLLATLLPNLGMVFSMGLMSTLSYSADRSPLLMLLPTGMMAVVSIGSSVMMYRDQIKSRQLSFAQKNERFERILQLRMAELEGWRQEECKIRLENDPPLDRIRWMIEVDDLRLWERRPPDTDFASVRIGIGELAPAVVLQLPEADMLAPRYQEINTIYEEHRMLPDMPITINLRHAGTVGVWGDNRPMVLEAVYAMLGHLIAHHAPHELRIALLCDEGRAANWDWLKWVKHNESLQPDLPGRSVAIGKEGAHVLLEDLSSIVRSRVSPDGEEGPPPASDPPPIFSVHYLVLIDHYNLVKDEAMADYLLAHASQGGVTVIDIESDPRDVPDICQARMEISPTGRAEFATVGPEAVVRRCQLDRLNAHQVGELARQLTNKHQARSTTTVSNIPTSVRLIDALFATGGKTRVAVDEIEIAQKWATRPPEQTWSILLGWKQNNEPVWLNLLENRDGPHGLGAGTTGAGKSILLQSMILSLALTHSPDEINFVLIDFKGGSTAEAFRDLPHTISVITNLQGRLVDRSLAILKAEARRRQEVLKQTGAKDIATYHARQEQERLSPLPRLVVIIDEFAEMAKALPTFMDEVNSIAAIGRSLGMHLILATQKPAGVVPDKVWANLKFRICLRVADTSDSRDMLGIADAALLPSSLPGRAYLRVGSERLELFQSANIAYPYRPGATEPERTEAAIVVRRAGLTADTTSAPATKKSSKAVAGQTELDVLVTRIAQARKPVPRWPNPLPPEIAIEQVWQQQGIPPAWQWTEDGERLVFTATTRPLTERLQLAIGLIDDPHNQAQRPLWMDLGRQHYLVAGGPRSGCSTLIQTVVHALLVNTTPEELHISLLDFGGQNLTVFESAPHVANVLSVNTPLRLRRFLMQVGDDLDRRAKLRADRQLEGVPEALYIIDGFVAVRDLFPDETEVLARVAREGLALGVHLIIVADRVLSVPMKIRSNLLGRLALHLTDAGDYLDLVGRISGSLPDEVPGRGLVREQIAAPVLEFQIALPMGKQQGEAESYTPLLETELFSGLHRLSQALDEAWQGSRPIPTRILEPLIDAQALPEMLRPGGQTWGQMTTWPKAAVGQGDRRLEWVEIDYSIHGPHFLVCGPPQSGKTNLLRAWVWNLCERYAPDEVEFTLIGMRNRSLSDLTTLPHVQEVVDTEFRLDATLERLKSAAEQRHQRLKEQVEAHPEGDVSEMARELGPVYLVVVDDFDTVRFTRQRQDLLMDFARYGHDTRTFIILGGDSNDLAEYSDLLKYVKRGRSAFMLQPGDAELRATGVHLPASVLRQEFPIGRGYVILGNRIELLQTLYLEDGYLSQRCKLLSL